MIICFCSVHACSLSSSYVKNREVAWHAVSIRPLPHAAGPYRLRITAGPLVTTNWYRSGNSCVCHLFPKIVYGSFVSFCFHHTRS